MIGRISFKERSFVWYFECGLFKILMVILVILSGWGRVLIF